MRMMMRIVIPTEAGNRAIKDGSLGRVIQATMERIRPEAAFFAAEDGNRTAYLFFDLKDPSEMPSIAEPIFMGLDAKVELFPVMNPEELKVGLEKLGRH